MHQMARKQLFGVKLDQESIGTRELPVTSRSPVLMLMAAEERWYFTKEEINNSPSRRCGIDAEKELSYRQQGANLIQDMGQRLQVYPFVERVFCVSHFSALGHLTSSCSARNFPFRKIRGLIFSRAFLSGSRGFYRCWFLAVKT